MTAATPPVIEQKIAAATGGTDADRDRLRQLIPAGTIPCWIVFDLSNERSWTNAAQVELILEEMTADHRANVADMLGGFIADQDGWTDYVAEAALRLLLDKVPLSYWSTR